ncbi:MAG: DnaB-like helicase C-terminal domain-containing protein, partial [Thermoguttaceae bacterium]
MSVLPQRETPNEAISLELIGEPDASKVASPVRGWGRSEISDLHHDAEYLPLFLRDLSTPIKPIPTGFTQLDNILDGGLRPGTFFFGAMPSLGKTTLVLQIANSIASSGVDVLFLSLEMSRQELVAKTFSRLSYEASMEIANSDDFAMCTKTILEKDFGRNNPFYSSENRVETTQKVFQKISEMFDSIAPNMFIHYPNRLFSMDDVRTCTNTLVNKRANTSSRPPVIVIDYLQMLSCGEEDKTKRDAIDKNVLELKHLAAKLATPIIVISSLNRNNYKALVSFESFKESGGIEYGADCVAGLNLVNISKGHVERPHANFDIDAAKEKDPREIGLSILKNRNGRVSGSTGIYFEYKSKFHHFKELDGEFESANSPKNKATKGDKSKSPTLLDD